MALTAKHLMMRATERILSQAGDTIELEPPVAVRTRTNRRLLVCEIGLKGPFKNLVRTTRFPTWFRVGQFRLAKKK